MLETYFVTSSIGAIVLLLLLTRGRIRFDDVATCVVLGFAGGWLLWPLIVFALTKRGRR